MSPSTQTKVSQPQLFTQLTTSIVINGDAQSLPVRDDSVDLVVTSPPYNCDTQYDTYNDWLPESEYLEMLWHVWEQCFDAMKPGARLCINVPFGTGRNPWYPLGAVVTESVNKMFELLGVIIWDKGVSGGRTTWGSWRLPSAPALRDCAELVVVGKKPGRLDIPRESLSVVDGNGRSVSPWLSADDFTMLTQSVWHIRPETRKAAIPHPCPFPIELAERLIRLYGYPGCVVLDPFAGSGTLGVAAERLGAKSVLIDIDGYYCRVAKRRIQNEGL